MNEELEEYKNNLKAYQESSQWEYRMNHPSCKYCENYKQVMEFWSYPKKCIISGKTDDDDEHPLIFKIRAKNCQYYFPKTDLS